MADKPTFSMVSLSDEDMMEVAKVFYAEFDRRQIPDPVALAMIAYLIGDMLRNRMDISDDELGESMAMFAKMMFSFTTELVEKKPRDTSRAPGAKLQ